MIINRLNIKIACIGLGWLLLFGVSCVPFILYQYLEYSLILDAKRHAYSYSRLLPSELILIVKIRRSSGIPPLAVAVFALLSVIKRKLVWLWTLLALVTVMLFMTLYFCAAFVVLAFWLGGRGENLGGSFVNLYNLMRFF